MPGQFYVLSGRVTLSADGEVWEARTGDMLVIPAARHTLKAGEDATVLFTSVPRSRAG